MTRMRRWSQLVSRSRLLHPPACWRVCHIWSTSLALCAPADLPAACAPALAQAHTDLATYLATVLVGR